MSKEYHNLEIEIKVNRPGIYAWSVHQWNDRSGSILCHW